MRSLRRDPAPSRWAYRLQRWMLTPLFVRFLRYGVPALVIGGGLALYLAPIERRDAIAATYAEIRRGIEERPEFMVTLMAIDGGGGEVAEDIRDIVPLDFPLSSFDLDLPAIKARIEELDAVASVQVRVRAGGVLQIDVVERQPAVVWRGPEALELLDAEGHRVVPIAARADRADLPLLAGEGASLAVPEALAILEAAEPLAPRLRGLLRVGMRRWDVVLDRDQRILLPEDRPVEALMQVLALDGARDLLARDVTVIDMRNPARLTLRLGPDARPVPNQTGLTGQ